MGALLLVMLFVTFVPLAEGVLLAFLLREVYARHPLPLVEPGYINAWYRPPSKIVDPTEGQVATAESATGDVTSEEKTADNAEIPAAPTSSESAPQPTEASVFDGSENVAKYLPVNEALDSMTAEKSENVPHDLENRVEESTRLKDGVPNEMSHIKDDLDLDDLEDLAAALPKTNIDFTQEHEPDQEAHEPDDHEKIVPLAKELLGENFDFNALEQDKPHWVHVPVHDTNAENSVEITVDVQEDNQGGIQVSSPFLYTEAPQLADFSMPQMILPTFSDDWIQESDNIIEPTTENVANFCFTEESPPMFVRKKKAN